MQVKATVTAQGVFQYKEVQMRMAPALEEITVPVLCFSGRAARRIAARSRMPQRQQQAVVHFNNLLHDHGFHIVSLLSGQFYHDHTRNSAARNAADSLEVDMAVAPLDPNDIRDACKFIDSLGDGDGEIEIAELRLAFRRARQLVNRADPEAKGRVHMKSLAKALEILGLSAEKWFESLGSVDPEKGVGQMDLFKALRRLSDELQVHPKLGTLKATKAQDRFEFDDDSILEMMSFIDPNHDGMTTLEEIVDGISKATDNFNVNKAEAAAAKVLKELEKAMVAEGGDIATIFAEIDKDGSGSVNTEELTEALSEFHSRRHKERQHGKGMSGLSKEQEFSGSFNPSHSIHTASTNKTTLLQTISDWTASRGIQDADIALRDVEYVVDWADPNCDNEITASELVDSLNDLIGNIGSGDKRTTTSDSPLLKSAQLGSSPQYDDFAAGRLVARVFSAMYYRNITAFELFEQSVSHCSDEKLQEKNSLLAKALAKNAENDAAGELPSVAVPEHEADEADETEYARCGDVCQVLASLLATDCADQRQQLGQLGADALALDGHHGHPNPAAVDKGNPNKGDSPASPTHGSEGRDAGKDKGDKGKSNQALPLQALQQTIVDICNVANRTIDIFGQQDILAATTYFGLVDRPVVTQFELADAFIFASPEQLTKEGKAEKKDYTKRIKLCRKLQHVMVKNGHHLHGLFKTCFANEARQGHDPDVDVHSDKATVRLTNFVHGALLDVSDAIHAATLMGEASLAAHGKSKEGGLDEPLGSAESGKEMRLLELTSGHESADRASVAANVTATRPPKPSWKELRSLQSQLLSRLKRKSAVRISAATGVRDAVEIHGGGDWVTLYSGLAEELNISDAVDVLLGGSKPLAVYTIRTQNVTTATDGEGTLKEEIFQDRHFVVFVTSPEAPVIVRGYARPRELQVEWPKLETATLGDCRVKLSLEVCTGRKWVSGKVRQSANTMSLLTSAGKKSFRTVYTETVWGSRSSLSRSGSSGRGKLGLAKWGKKVKVTDLDPACWYHLRYRVDYERAKRGGRNEFLKGGVEDGLKDDFAPLDAVVHLAVGQGRAFGGVRSANTEPDVPEAPEMPRSIVDYKQSFMSMSSNIQATLKLSWTGSEENGHETKYYIVQKRLGRLLEIEEPAQSQSQSSETLTEGVGGNGLGGSAALTAVSIGRKGGSLQFREEGTTLTEGKKEKEGTEGKEGKEGKEGGGGIQWKSWETCYTNKFEQYFVKPPPLGTAGMQFRICAVNILGGSPWGEVLELTGSKYKEFFSSGTEDGLGSAGGEGGGDHGLDKFILRQTRAETIRNKKGKSLEGGDKGEEGKDGEEARTEGGNGGPAPSPNQRTQERFDLLGKTKREKMEAKKVVAFGRAVEDDMDLFGGGKMEAFTLTGDTLPTITASRGHSLEQQALNTTFERSAEIIQDQVDFPVSLGAARLALKSVQIAKTELVTRLPSSRMSPSPMNYLQKVRDDRERLERARYEDIAGELGVEGMTSLSRPSTAPPPSSSLLAQKWRVDEKLSKEM